MLLSPFGRTQPTGSTPKPQLNEQQREGEWIRCGLDNRHRLAQIVAGGAAAKWASALRSARRVVQRRSVLALLGTRGGGKTQIGAELIRDHIANGYTAKYVRALEIGMAIREAYAQGAKISERDAIHIFTQPDLLVIDELQDAKSTEAERANIATIIDLRYAKMKPTVLIANASDEAFKLLAGDSVIDRMREGGGIIHCDWPSFRAAPKFQQEAPNAVRL